MQSSEGQKEYDFVIVGSGLGGLACANILAWKVSVWWF
jgi:all-trans-retinol 13,14-reductase